MSLFSRVSDAWAAIAGRPSQGLLAVQNELVHARREVAALKMELREAKDTLEEQRKRIADSESNYPSNCAHRLENLFSDLAAPLSQLRMQSSLMDSGKEISSRSVMALASRLWEMIERAGLEPIGSTGEKLPFDSTVCEPVSADSSFAKGEEVTVRFIGYRYENRILRKALVERSS